MNTDLKTIGLLGGMAWPSTQDYYFFLNKGIEKRLGSNHSAKCIIYSYDFDSINHNYRDSEEIISQLEKGIRSLQAASVDLILICSNTTHKFLDTIRRKYRQGLFLDIRDCVGLYLQKNNISNCLLLGTKFTMSEPFYRDYLTREFNINIAVPDEDDQLEVHSLIFQELINDTISDKAIDFFSKLAESSGAESIILGCTELRIAFNKIRTTKRIIDSTGIHANAAIDFITKNES